MLSEDQQAAGDTVINDWMWREDNTTDREGRRVQMTFCVDLETFRGKTFADVAALAEDLAHFSETAIAYASANVRGE